MPAACGSDTTRSSERKISRDSSAAHASRWLGRRPRTSRGRLPHVWDHVMEWASTWRARVGQCPPWRLGRWWPPPSTHWMAPVAIHCRYTYAAASASTSGFLSGASSTSSRFTASIFASQLRTVRRREDIAATLTTGNMQLPCFISTHAAGRRPQHGLNLDLTANWSRAARPEQQRVPI
jgi:hypothetical protein